MDIKSLNSKLSNSVPSVGTWLQIPSPHVASILSRLNYDWVVADLEHGNFTRAILPDIFCAIKQGGAVPFARLADNTRENVKAALDSGAEGLIFPMIENREMLDSAISYSLYPSEGGTRGVGFCIANIYGYDFDTYTQQTASEIVLIAQIEHKNALDNLDDILSHPRLNGIIIGPYDLSASMGIMGQLDNPLLLDAIEYIKQKAFEYSVPMGIHLVKPDEKQLRKIIDDGYRFISYGMDTVFIWENAKVPSDINK